MRRHRPRIPTILEVIADAEAADFDQLGSPFTDRSLTEEDFGAGWIIARPDLVPVRVRSGSGTVLKVTRTKVLSGKIRKR
ncbi:hypothetical protein [Solilutibacter tolerans]|uniref:Uncharacterized protein n=1 Tax=Solilutibacter tolerans TaxID=1604334 RepID=A0A1N6N3H9_9GAMM|nr:hypothetical protein [Lysobacter tolerans]SIP86616.1 hypothetical protein SAMN05421546_0060 [Lysobacter tolerans]